MSMSQPQQQAGLDEFFGKLRTLRSGLRSQVLSQQGGILSQLQGQNPQQQQQQQKQPANNNNGGSAPASNPLATVLGTRLLSRLDQTRSLKATLASQIMQNQQQQYQPPPSTSTNDQQQPDVIAKPTKSYRRFV